MHRRWLLISFVAAVAALSLVMIVVGGSDKPSSWNDPVKQWATIKFSHKQHVGEVGAECSSCHAAAQTSENANDLMFPKHEQCSECHSAEIESDCLYCHTQEDKYEAFAAPKREVRFSHKQHVSTGSTAETGKLECSTCHAGIETSEKPSVAFLPIMSSCNTCHNDVKATSACESCHTQSETLLPISHQQANWAKEHKRLVRIEGLALSAAEGVSNDCAVCHSENFCQACHADVTTQFTRGERTRSVAENRPAASGKPVWVKARVHELNFVFTHAMDLRAKQSDCSSCHNQQTFCSNCHTRNQDAGFAAPLPLSHRAADFIRLGKGSGGGQHAVLARRDMESCASCHDVEGRDPVCVTCHADLAPKGRK